MSPPTLKLNNSDISTTFSWNKWDVQVLTASESLATCLNPIRFKKLITARAGVFCALCYHRVQQNSRCWKLRNKKSLDISKPSFWKLQRITLPAQPLLSPRGAERASMELCNIMSLIMKEDVKSSRNTGSPVAKPLCLAVEQQRGLVLGVTRAACWVWAHYSKRTELR